jgi:hypothetical protein
MYLQLEGGGVEDELRALKQQQQQRPLIRDMLESAPVAQPQPQQQRAGPWSDVDAQLEELRRRARG